MGLESELLQKTAVSRLHPLRPHLVVSHTDGQFTLTCRGNKSGQEPCQVNSSDARSGSGSEVQLEKGSEVLWRRCIAQQVQKCERGFLPTRAGGACLRFAERASRRCGRLTCGWWLFGSDGPSVDGLSGALRRPHTAYVAQTTPMMVLPCDIHHISFSPPAHGTDVVFLLVVCSDGQFFVWNTASCERHTKGTTASLPSAAGYDFEVTETGGVVVYTVSEAFAYSKERG